LAEIKANDAMKIGLKKGREEGMEKTIKILLTQTDFSVEKIASMFGVSSSLVMKLSKGLRSE
ncbi:MAG: hypothetical protein ACYCOO_10325, partial [Chitinophagaceae bacterium]